jgi:glycosyltransferase involved in cell wall biosynthesis
MSSSRPRLLYVVTLAEVGGAQSYVRDLLSAAAEQYDVGLAAHGDGPLRTAAERMGIPFFPLRYVRRAISPWYDALGLLELVMLFRRFRPDVVHLNSSKVGILGRLAAVLARVRTRVFTAHGWAFDATHGTARTMYRWADRAVRPLATMIICVSEYQRSEGLQAGVCTAERSLVIANGVELGPVPSRAAAGGLVEIVSVGRLAEPKDFSTLIRSMSLLRPETARLRLLGDGPLRASLDVEIAELALGSVVELAGEVPDVRERLSRADVFVLSSSSEGMPISVLEAMASALPVVASGVPGMEELVVDGETGFLVEPGDAEAFADRLQRLTDDTALRTTLGAAGRRRAEDRFSLASWRRAHLELYGKLLAERGRDI